ncbi:hypothetical protein ACL2XP_17790 [Sodalis sp. RH21]|uniref:hypothetical protein n=1 Tax=unclassified Sodalis (in: enterobacteria) TaxID=2636512 RepID=UPI0039B3FE34
MTALRAHPQRTSIPFAYHAPHSGVLPATGVLPANSRLADKECPEECYDLIMSRRIGVSMKLIILSLSLSLLLITGCSGVAGSLFKIIPANTDVCPHGHNVFTNQCNP